MVGVSQPVFVLLLVLLQAVAVVTDNSGDSLVRKRRHWIIPPKGLIENEDYTKETFVAKIRSDYETNDNIEYSLEGIGVNQYPYNVFVVHPKTGLIRVTKVLDREAIAMYNLSGVARYLDGSLAEKNIDIRIKVLDENDNPPVFEETVSAAVNELSPAGTSVMKVIATDADEPGNENSQIAYSIIDQNPHHDMFYITSDGTLYVKKPTLDRELEDQYVLKVKGQDLNGKPGGNTGTGTVTINVKDVNDNLPTLAQEQYEGNIEENTHGVEVMRLKADDLDLKGTENWDAVFDIVKGNEAKYFSITTDPVTNEGILMLDKSVDYEDVKDLDLGITVRNKAPPYGSGQYDGTSIGFGGGGAGAPGGGAGAPGGGAGAPGGGAGAPGGGAGAPGGGAGAPGGGYGTGGSSWSSGTTFKTYPVKINVKNQVEGPAFDPKVKAIPISEEGRSIINQVIARYPAIDGDTRKPAKRVRYAKGSDPDHWLTIDPQTAEIKLNKIPDRESVFLVNGTYIAKVLCITEDMPAKTATGTIAIQVEDFNDNCPTLTSAIQSMCTTDDSVIVKAVDEDSFPNGPPFDFAIIPEDTQGKWQVEHLNDTAAILRVHEHLWPGEYEVALEVKDEQGYACPEPQKVKVQVCTCEDGVLCGQVTKGAELGPAGIGLLLLGLLLLLLIPLLLLFCRCGGAAGMPWGFTDMPFDTKSHLINYHTEGQGQNTQVPLMNMATHGDGEMANVAMGMAGAASAGAPMVAVDSQKSFADVDGMGGGFYQDGFANYREGAWGMNNQMGGGGGGFYSEFQGREATAGGGMFDGMALPDHLLKQYYAQKLASGNENLGGKNNLLVYDYEGQDSSAGSVGCCSLLESDNDLQFLDNLGLKFKTLAEVCGGKRIPVEVKEVSAHFPSASISTQSSVSSMMTGQQLPPLPQLQPPLPKAVQTVVRETTERSQMLKENATAVREGMTAMKGGIANQGQILLLQQQQQPIYLTAAPMPMHYVVQPQVQNTMLLAEEPATNLQGMGMVLVNANQPAPTQGMIIQGQSVMSGAHAQGPGMMLVGMSGVHSGGANLINAGNLSGSQAMMVVEGKVPAGSVKVLKGGTLPAGGPSGSQRVLVVGGPVGSRGQLVQEGGGLSPKSDISGSQNVVYTMSSTSPGTTQGGVVSSSTTAVSKTPTYRKVVVQKTREII